LNLLATCARHFENETKDELTTILQELGDDSPQVSMTEFSGILYVNTSADPKEVVKRICQKIEDEPWSIRYTLRAIPIATITKTDVQEIADAALKQAEIMKSDETYRITIEKRNSSVSSGEIISEIANKIANKVSLEKYDWIVLVEVLGDTTGISVLRDEDVLSVERQKRGSLD